MQYNAEMTKTIIRTKIHTTIGQATRAFYRNNIPINNGGNHFEFAKVNRSEPGIYCVNFRKENFQEAALRFLTDGMVEGIFVKEWMEDTSDFMETFYVDDPRIPKDSCWYFQTGESIPTPDDEIKDIEGSNTRPSDILPFKEEDTLKINHVMILADPIKRGEDELWFKFSMPYGEGDTRFDYEAEAFCLNFTYENFVNAKGLCLSIYDLNLMVATVFEWTNTKGEAMISLLANDEKFFAVDSLMRKPSECSEEIKARYWPPVMDGV